MSRRSDEYVRFTAWSAIFGCLFAYLNVALVLAATGKNTDAIFNAASMLMRPTQELDLFRWAMLADILGFYLPVLVIGGYLWHAFRDKAGTLGDMAMLAVPVYVVVGIAGAAMQQAVLHPLADLHAAGGEAVKAATEASWTAVVYGSQKGLWWCEGPVVFFWGGVVGSQLRRAGWGRWFLALFAIIRWSFGLFFVTGFFAKLDGVTDALETIVVLLFPLWMLIFGCKLLRLLRSAPASV